MLCCKFPTWFGFWYICKFSPFCCFPKYVLCAEQVSWYSLFQRHIRGISVGRDRCKVFFLLLRVCEQCSAMHVYRSVTWKVLTLQIDSVWTTCVVSSLKTCSDFFHFVSLHSLSAWHFWFTKLLPPSPCCQSLQPFLFPGGYSSLFPPPSLLLPWAFWGGCEFSCPSLPRCLSVPLHILLSSLAGYATLFCLCHIPTLLSTIEKQASALCFSKPETQWRCKKSVLACAAFLGLEKSLPPEFQSCRPGSRCRVSASTRPHAWGFSKAGKENADS